MRELIRKILREAADENIAQYCNSDPRIKKTLENFVIWRTRLCLKITLLDEKAIDNEVRKNFTGQTKTVKVYGLDNKQVEVNKEQFKEILRGKNKEREQKCGGTMFENTSKLYTSRDYCSQEILDDYFDDNIRKAFNSWGKFMLKDEVFGVEPLENCNVFYLNTCYPNNQIPKKETQQLPTKTITDTKLQPQTQQIPVTQQTNQDKFRKGVENVSQSVKGGVYSATNYLKGKSGN